jgi:hypothetical protein
VIRSWRRFWSLVPIVTLCVFASRVALGAVHDGDAAKLREAAIYSDYLATDFASAEKKLTQALGLCERPADCSSTTRARLHCDLGVVEFASQKAADGRAEFARAIKEDPAVTIDADLTTPELQKELLTAKVSAAKSAGAGGANPQPQPVAGGGSPPADGGRPSVLTDGGALAPAYAGTGPSTADGGRAIADGGRAIADGGSGAPIVYAGGAAGPHAIPVGGASSGAAAPPKTVASAIGPGSSTATASAPGKSAAIAIASGPPTASAAVAPSKSSAIAPAPGKTAPTTPAPGKTAAGGPATNPSTASAPPPSPATAAAPPPTPATTAPPPATLASASSSADCPPGFPGCKSSEPTSCSSDDDCGPGETCGSGTCRAMGSATPGKANWVSLALQLDVPLLPAKNNVCAGGQGYSCFNSDGSWYSDTPTEGGGGAIQSAGLKPGTLRVLIGYDRRLLDNLTLGGAIGFAFRGGPTRQGGTAFLPLTLEVRGKYWLGHYPLGRTGLRFYGLLDGGLADIAASLTTYVYATPTAQGTAKTAWYHMGRGYAGLGLGSMFAFTPNMGVFLEVRAMESFPTSGTAIAGQIGYGVGL